MKIGFVGAGKVGKAFGIYLAKKGFDVEGYYSKSFSSSKLASEMVKTKSYENICDLVDVIDILFITTNDDEIKNVCEYLVNTKTLKKGQILIHMSGASSSKILNDAKKNGCFIYSLHPLQSFADVSKSVSDLNNTVFSLEGDKEKIEIIENILNKLGNKYFKITSEQKSLYHITACVVSNYLVTLIDYGLDIFQSIGIGKKEGYAALYPLIEGTIKNIQQLDTEKALTGPIARSDTKTIRNHLNSLQDKTKDVKDIYKILGKKTLQLATKENLINEDKFIEMNKLFEEVL